MKQVRRNDPCPCGSGRKYKKCCVGKAPRNRYIYIGYNQPFKGVTLGDAPVLVHMPSGKKEIADAVMSRMEYARASGKPKVVASVSGTPTLEVSALLATQFDWVWAIDTNTKQIDENRVSIASALECRVALREPGKLEVKHREHLFAFKNRKVGEEERFAWYRLVTLLTKSDIYRKERVALITDHDLGNHPRYNARELPIYGEALLPENVTLLFATSDTGSDTVLNMLIKKCDSSARNLLSQLEEGGVAAFGDKTFTVADLSEPTLA